MKTKDVVPRILTAKVYDVAVETPMQQLSRLSARFDRTILLKREDLQPVHSFKLRGAYNKIVGLTSDQLKKGIIAASAGNHAQGVALAAQSLGVNALIVMPKTTPKIKVESVKQRGAKTVLVGDTYDDAYAHAKKLATEKGYTFVHPYDDLDVIAGQGTVAMEILRQCNDGLEAIFVPVGGGGLLAGVLAYVKETYPKVKVIGVEPEDAACLEAALAAKKRVTLPYVGIFADGVAVRQIGKLPFEIVKDHIDAVITATTDEICAAIKDIYDDTRSIAEPAGALSLAGLKKYCAKKTSGTGTLVAIQSGANVNFDRLRHVSERAEIGEEKEALFAITIPETPGSFRRLCKTLGKRSITEFNYRYSDSESAHLFVGIELENGSAERKDILKMLKDKAYPVKDLTDNEMAKIHVRHMVGGRGVNVDNEVIYRFQFPERPGALLNFLDTIGQKHNISLFHYRNHGAAYGRVLVGIQIPFEDRDAFNAYLDELGYPYFEETSNIAYKLFLG